MFVRRALERESAHGSGESGPTLDEPQEKMLTAPSGASAAKRIRTWTSKLWPAATGPPARSMPKKTLSSSDQTSASCQPALPFLSLLRTSTLIWEGFILTQSGRAMTSPTLNPFRACFPALSTWTDRFVQSPPALMLSGTPFTVSAGPSTNGSSGPPTAPAIRVLYQVEGEWLTWFPTRLLPSEARSKGTTGLSAAKEIRTSTV